MPSNYSSGGAGGGNYSMPSTYSGGAYQNQYQTNPQQSVMDSKEVIGLLQEIANKDQNLYVDGSKMTQSLYPHIQQYNTQRGGVLVK